MLFPFAMSSADNFASLFVFDYLGLKCVFFLFPTKELFLFFFDALSEELSHQLPLT